MLCVQSRANYSSTLVFEERIKNADIRKKRTNIYMKLDVRMEKLSMI